MKLAYGLAEKANNKWHLLALNLTLVALGLYVPIQKLTAFSVTDSLTHVFAFDAAIVVKILLIYWVIYCAIARLALLILDALPTAFAKAVEPESVNECTLRINDEIKRQIDDLIADASAASDNFVRSHPFEVNVAHVVENMAEHVMRAFNNMKVRPRDVFISVYKVPEYESVTAKPTSLTYVTHFDHKRPVVFSKKIPLDDAQYADYECVKTIVGGQSACVKFDCTQYAKTKANRHKTVKHYVGFRLEAAGQTIGFINVEFHNHQFFLNEEKMTDFVERELHAFRCLIEYQFLKRKFFHLVKSKLISPPQI